MPTEVELFAWFAQMFRQADADRLRKPSMTAEQVGKWLGNSAIGWMEQGNWAELLPDEFFFRAAQWTTANGFPDVSAVLNTMEGDIVDNEWPTNFA